MLSWFVYDKEKQNLASMNVCYWPPCAMLLHLDYYFLLCVGLHSSLCENCTSVAPTPNPFMYSRHFCTLGLVLPNISFDIRGNEEALASMRND